MTSPQKKILIIDDDKFLLDMYSIKFREAGFDVHLAPSSTEVIKKIEEGLTPDVILLDIVMPEMNGLELLQKLRKEPGIKDASVIILSNQGQPTDVEEAKKYNVDGYIVKANTIPSEVLDKVVEISSKKHG